MAVGNSHTSPRHAPRVCVPFLSLTSGLLVLTFPFFHPYQVATHFLLILNPISGSHYDFSQDLTMKGPQAANSRLNSFIPTIPTFQLRLSLHQFWSIIVKLIPIYIAPCSFGPLRAPRSVHTLYYESRCSELYNSVLFFPKAYHSVLVLFECQIHVNSSNSNQ